MEIIKQFLKHQKGKLYIMTARRLIKLKKEIWEIGPRLGRVDYKLGE